MHPFLRQATYITAHLTILVISCVLLGAFGVQFIGQEYPCPLCILQRMAMILAVAGPAHMIVMGNRKGQIEPAEFTTAFGMMVLGSVLGAAISIRQILLHIAPGDPGYGSPVFDIHLYTWALLVFVALLITAGIHLCLIRDAIPLVPKQPSILSKFVLWLFWLVILVNAASVFAQSGFHLYLPDNPTSYRLFH